MASINEAVWGAASDWKSAYNYAASIPQANRLKTAYFNDDYYGNTIEQAIVEGKLEVGVPWDKSLSYCALGMEHPLSKIEYWGAGSNSLPGKMALVNKDARLITNFSLGSGGKICELGDNNSLCCMQLTSDVASANLPRYDRFTNGAEQSTTSLSGYLLFVPFTQIPTKRIVLYPELIIGNNDLSASTAYDLNTAIDNKGTRNKLLQITLHICTDINATYDPEAGTGTPSRAAVGDLKAMALLDPLAYGNGYRDNLNIDLSNITRPIISSSLASGIPVAGSLFPNPYLWYNKKGSYSDGDWCVPLASGFGFDFTSIYGLDAEGKVRSDNESHFYCDISSMTEDEIREGVRHILACFGLFFADTRTDAETKKLDDPSIMLGTLEDGIGHGDYTSGAENREQLQWSLDDMHDLDYDPSNPPKVDPNNYDVPMHNNYPWIASPNRLYSINSTNIATITGLYNSLWQCYYENDVGTGSGQKQPTEFNYDEFLTISPIDTIISLKLFPYDTSANHNPVGVRLGKYAAGINAYTAEKFTVLDFGTLDIFAYFGASEKGDWRDRETKYTLYAPFCGTLELDPAFYMGKTIGLQYWVDQITGACTAAIYMNDDRGNFTFTDTVSGVLAVDVPITGLDQATIQSQIFSANQQLKLANINAATGIINSVLQVGGAALQGDAASAATSFIGGVGNFVKSNAAVESAQYNLTHNKTAPRQIGSASPLSAMLGDWIPRVIISKPVDPLSKSEFKEFAETKGIACIIPGKIGSRKGFIQMQNVKLTAPQAATIPMTQTEADMIRSLLSSGIFIK